MSTVRGTRDRGAALVLACGVAVQFSLGIPVIWGVFQPYIMAEYGWNGPAAAMAFTLTNAFFAVGALIGGRLHEVMSPRRVIVGGVSLASLGLYATSLTSSDCSAIMYLAFGVVNGIGGGSAITAVVTSTQKWFPHRRGFAVGVLATSTGLAGTVMTPVCRALLTNAGVPATFRTLAVGVLLVGTLSALAIRNPPETCAEEGPGCTQTPTGASQRQDLTTREMLRTRQFYVLVLIMFFTTPAFVLMNPFVVTLSIERGLDESAAAAGVMLVTLSNALGRAAVPVVSDSFGRRPVVTAALAAASLAAFSLVKARGYGVIAAASVVAFVHGGVLSMLPVISSDLFGLRHAGQNYGLIFLGSGVSALLAQLVSSPWAATGSSTTAPLLAAGCSVTAALVLTLTLGRKILQMT